MILYIFGAIMDLFEYKIKGIQRKRIIKSWDIYITKENMQSTSLYLWLLAQGHICYDIITIDRVYTHPVM